MVPCGILWVPIPHSYKAIIANRAFVEGDRFEVGTCTAGGLRFRAPTPKVTGHFPDWKFIIEISSKDLHHTLYVFVGQESRSGLGKGNVGTPQNSAL